MFRYVSPALSRRSGDSAHVTTGVPGGSATGNDDRGGMGAVPESHARIDDMYQFPPIFYMYPHSEYGYQRHCRAFSSVQNSPSAVTDSGLLTDKKLILA